MIDLIENEVIQTTKIKPLVGFLGIGWIGLNRLHAIVKENVILADAVADIRKEHLTRALTSVPDAKTCENIVELMSTQPDGVVIATPSALHASQAIYALEKGASVFCQKPLGRTALETRNVVETARKYNKLLGVDYSYRLTEGMQKIFKLIKSGALGKIFAINLIFHNAFGPEKKWFYNPQLSGGGCVIDLGSHLIDLSLWVLGFPLIKTVSSILYAGGHPIKNPETDSEDFADVSMETLTGTVIHLSCSWNMYAGQDAEISACFYGTNGGACFRNVNGSSSDFEAFRFYGKSKREILVSPPDDWGGRAAIQWAKRLASGSGFNDENYEFIRIAEVIDAIYKR